MNCVDVTALGIAVFAGTRVPLSTVVYSLDSGLTLDRLRHTFPFVTAELVQSAREYLAQAKLRREWAQQQAGETGGLLQ